MSVNPYPRHWSGHGFSLIEIMISVVVGMLGILVIMQVFLVAEGYKRTTTGGADAQENAAMAMFTLEREIRVAGLGLVGLGCTTVNAWDDFQIPPAFSFNPWPVTIQRDTPAVGSDTIYVLHSNSPFGSIPTNLTDNAPVANKKLTVANGDGFDVGNMAILSEAGSGKACTMVEITKTKTGNGSSWELETKNSTWNPPDASQNFPAGGYVIGARLTNMGSMVNYQYYVANNSLMMRNVNYSPFFIVNPITLVSGVVAIRAQYGRDTNADGYVDIYDNTDPTALTDVVAVRLAVVARSGQLEKTAVSPATLVLWSGGTTANGGAIALDATAQRYRYKVYQTNVPLRNVLWNV